MPPRGACSVCLRVRTSTRVGHGLGVTDRLTVRALVSGGGEGQRSDMGHPLVRATSAAVLALASGLGCGHSAGGRAGHRAPSAPSAPTIHAVTGSGQGLRVNAYLVEGAAGVVVVDSALTVTDAQKLRAALDALHKPLLGVLLTHGHPDHYNGVSALLAGQGDVPVFATAAVDAVIRRHDAQKAEQWGPMFGAEWPSARSFPSRVVSDGAVVELGGARFRVRDLGPGESHADSTWELLEASPRRLFIGDVVLHGEHAYVSDGHTAAWLAHLAELSAALPADVVLYPGHGAQGGRELLAWQSAYLTSYRGELAALRNEQGELDAAAAEELSRRMVAGYPRAGLVFLIALGAPAVASELSRE